MDVELPGSVEDGMSGRNVQRKPGTSRGSPRRSRTAKAYKRYATKSRCAWEWGGWGRLSDDGPGQHNLDRSEGPWSRATHVARMAVSLISESRMVSPSGQDHPPLHQPERISLVRNRMRESCSSGSVGGE